MIGERLLRCKAFSRNIIVRVHPMPDSHVWFEWQVAREGYCWWQDTASHGEYRVIGYTDAGAKQELRPDDLYLVVNAELEKSPEMVPCSPLDATGLFRDFATLEPTPEAILGFANRHGTLSDGRLLITTDESGDDDADLPGEPFRVWAEMIARMEFLLQLWHRVQASDKRKLEQYIEWTDIFGHRGLRFKDGSGVFTTRDILGAPWLERVLRQRDVLFAAQFMLDSLVTEQLAGGLDAVLNRDGQQKPSLRFGPRDLRAALWLQFARAIEGDKEYLQCEHCRMWYEIGSREGARSDKRFCSTACRARNWRAAKAAATARDNVPRPRSRKT